MDERCDCCEGEDHGIGDVLSVIARGGWQVTAVMAGPTRDEPPFAYSTGLTSLGKPELIIYGVPQQAGCAIVDSVARHLTTDERVGPGTRISSADQPYDLALIEAVDTSDMIQTAALYARFRALQIVFPDEHNRFPWEFGHSPCSCVQPLMGPPPQ